MSRESYERGAELAAILARHTKLPANIIARHVCHLQRIARQAKASAIRDCNDAAYQGQHDRKIASLERHAAGMLADFGAGFTLTLDGDPRGPCCYLKIPGVRGDGMDPDAGHAIY